MKIYVLGSNSFVNEMVGCKNKLCELGFDGWIHQDYEDHVNGVKLAFPEKMMFLARVLSSKELMTIFVLTTDTFYKATLF